MNDITECIPKESWLQSWMQAWPLAESPRSYILFSGLACLGAALGRRVYFDSDVHKTFPLMNILLIGPSGIGKSTALRDIAVEHLMPALPDEIRPGLLIGKTTKEACHLDLTVQPKSIILASELANLFSKERYNEGAVPYFTDLMDLKAVRIRSRTGTNSTIQRPECCILGASTVAWLQEMMPSSSGEGGFLPRFLIIYEQHKFQRIADPRRHQTDQQRTELATQREKIFYDFARLVRINEGLIDFADYDASDCYTEWYDTFVPTSGALAPFAARAGAHVLRMALLLAVSCSRQTISAEDVRAAICLYTYANNKLAEVIVPLSIDGKNVSKIKETIGNLSLTGADIRRAMRNYLSGPSVDRVLAELVRDRELILEEGFYRRPLN